MVWVWALACGWSWGDRGLESAAPDRPRVAAPVPRGVTAETGHLSLVAMGDVMIHQAVEAAAADHARQHRVPLRHGYDAVFEGLGPVVRSVDLAFANLETPVSPSRFRPRRPRVFNADPIVVESLVETGFDLVSLANNHAFDQGPEGLVETMQTLSDRGLGYVGVGKGCEAAHAPVRLEIRGISLAFFAATELLNENWNVRPDAPCTAMLAVDDLIDRVGQVREEVDFVVVSLHWGDEYAIDPGPRRRRIAYRLVEAGVDVILGHHAHVLQPVELRRTRSGRVALIAYGLGNLVSNQAAWYVPGVHASRSAYPRDGLALSFRLSRRQVGRGAVATVHHEIVDVRTIPLWTMNGQPGPGPDIRVLPTTEAIRAYLGVDAASADVRRRWTQELRHRTAQVTRIVGPTVTPRPISAPLDAPRATIGKRADGG